MKKKQIIIFITIVILLVAAVLSLSDNLLSPYVSFSYAREHSGSYVQIIGTLDKKTPVTHINNGYTFSVADDKGTYMNVIHEGSKPLNFEHADKIVLLGKYSSETNIFQAEKVLVKCPSKYKKEQ